MLFIPGAVIYTIYTSPQVHLGHSQSPKKTELATHTKQT